MRIVIAEDSAVVRAGLAEILADRGHEVVAAVGNATDLLAAVAWPGWPSGSGPWTANCSSPARTTALPWSPSSYRPAPDRPVLTEPELRCGS